MDQRSVKFYRWEDMPKEKVSETLDRRLITGDRMMLTHVYLKKGAIVPAQLADLAVLSADYFSVPEDKIKGIESVLTVVDGKVVHGAGDFARLAC